MTPEQVVQAQVIAYNNRDIDAFLALHSLTAQLFDLPTGELICDGHPAIRERYRKRFESENLHTEIINRTVMGNYVIDHEQIIGIEPDRILAAIAIYEIQNSLIRRVWFIYSK